MGENDRFYIQSISLSGYGFGNVTTKLYLDGSSTSFKDLTFVPSSNLIDTTKHLPLGANAKKFKVEILAKMDGNYYINALVIKYKIIKSLYAL